MAFSPEYKLGYKNGFNSGYARGRGDAARHDNKAYWIMRGDDWYCSNCDTKYNQAHDDYCCKCGAMMDKEEAH